MGAEITVLFIFQILFGNLYLHLGLILAVFMAGMAAGTWAGTRTKIIITLSPVLLLAISIVYFISNMGIGTEQMIIFMLLYFFAASAGFASGTGFAILSAQTIPGRKSGATLYSADLYGAMAATIFIPGLLIVFGTKFVLGNLISIIVVILATLWYLRR